MKTNLENINIKNLKTMNKKRFLNKLTEELTIHGEEIKELIDSHNKQKFSYFHPKNEKKFVTIIDNPNPINRFPKFIRKWFTKTYENVGLVQFDGDKLAIVGDKVRFLETIKVRTTLEKRADMLSFVYLKEKYPEYDNYLQLF